MTFSQSESLVVGRGDFLNGARSVSLPLRNLTDFEFSDGPLFRRCDSIYEAQLKEVRRALSRKRRRHLLLYGERGVGKTRFLYDLAYRVRNGEIDSLNGLQIYYADCRSVRSFTETLCDAALLKVQEYPNVLLCLDGIEELPHKVVQDCRAPLECALEEIYGRLLITVTTSSSQPSWTYSAIRELFCTIRQEEPSSSVAEQVVTYRSLELGKEYDLDIPIEVSRCAVFFSQQFVLNDRLPRKAVRLLENVCENIAFACSELPGADRAIQPTDIAAAISDLTGVPLSHMSNASEPARNYAEALGEMVFGQAGAVQAASEELSLIGAGLTDANRPASVMLFVGSTGTGKTRLAKCIAQIYSGSKRLRTYTMGNFSEPHSVSGIIGVPPGYVGHENGGRLVEELIADPYSVVLLDEVEKAHPEVLKPFLNLFDDGWVVDQRGTRADAERAIFILTSNLGEALISELLKNGETPDRIAQRVTESLHGVRNPRTNQPVFSPAFLSRIKRVIVFAPLDSSAFYRITQDAIHSVCAIWRARMSKEVTVSESVLAQLSRVAYTANMQSGGREGARIVRKLISEQIEVRILREIDCRPSSFTNCRTVAINVASNHDPTDSTVPLSVDFVSGYLEAK